MNDLISPDMILRMIQAGSPTQVNAPTPTPPQLQQAMEGAAQQRANPPWHDFVNSILGGFTAKVNPEYYQQTQETQRAAQRAKLEQANRNSLTAYEQAQLAQHQAEQQRLSDQFDAQQATAEQARQAQERTRQDANSRFALEQSGRLEAAPPTNAPTIQQRQGIDFSGLPLQQQQLQPGLNVRPDAQMVGNQWMAPRMVNIPKGDDFSQMREMYPQGQFPAGDTGGQKLFDIIEQGMMKKQQREEFEKTLAPMVKSIHDELNGYEGSQGLSTMQKSLLHSFHNEIDTAAAKDKSIGSTTQLQGVQDKIRTFVTKNDPEMEAISNKNKLSMAYQMAAAGERGRVSENPDYKKPDPKDVSEIVDKALMNGQDYLDTVTKLNAGNKGLLRAISDEYTGRGDNATITKLSAQARESRDYAEVAQKEMAPLMAKVEELNKQGKLGAWASRYNGFMQGTVGKGDPNYSQLSGEVDLMRKLVGKIHLGVRGAGSPQNAEAMKKKLDEGKMDAPTLLAGLRSYKTFIDYYASMGHRSRAEVEAMKGGDTVEPDWVVDDKGNVSPNPKKVKK